MSEIANKQQSVEKYVEDTIIEYLRSQNAVSEHYYATAPEIYDELAEAALAEEEEKRKTLFIVEEVINDILHDLDRTIIYQKHYQETKGQHAQYALFDLADYVPGFYIDEQIIRQLCFRETLLISDVDHHMATSSDGVRPLSVGGLSLKIALAQGLPSHSVRTEKEIEQNILKTIQQLKKELAQAPAKNESADDQLVKYEAFLKEEMTKVASKFIVHLSTQFDVDGQNAGSRITSWVDKQFHTLEERRTEYLIKNEKNSKNQTLYFALQEDKYFIKHTTESADPTDTRRYYPLSMTKNMVGEGANFILMRYLAITKFKGNFELSTLYIDGSMCRNIYECKGARPGVVNGHLVDVCKIYRTIIEKCGIIHLSVTVLTVYGMIVSQEWEGCQYILHLNPEIVTMGRPVPYDYVSLKKVWNTNMEFVSKYLDCKTEAELKMKTYQKDHPELHEMMADYLQSVLLLKPENIMPFTIDYFMSFEPYRLPPLPYFKGDNDYRMPSEQYFW